MNIQIKRITIRNFKNLKDVTIYPRKFNVIVGPNGSGKTNFIEFFKLLRKIFSEITPYPFLEWDGYQNITWKKEKVPIEFEIEIATKKKIEVNRVTFTYNLFISYGIQIFEEAEMLKILQEIINIKVVKETCKVNMKIIRKGNMVYLYIEDKEIYSFSVEQHSPLIVQYWIPIHLVEGISSSEELKKVLNEFLEEIKKILSKQDINEKIKKKILYILEKDLLSIYGHASVLLHTLFLSILYLFILNINEIKYKTKIFPTVERLKERGENTLDILAQIQFRAGKLPERIENFVEMFFDGKIYFKGEAPGRLNLFLWDNKLRTEISKESLPDGLIRSLVILTALELKPSMLFIDEIENSLHPELLEYIIKELKNSKSYIFITTHNPFVLNLVDPEDILIFKPREDGSIEVKRVTDYKSKDELLRELEELGISLGEKVFYGLT